MQIHAVSVKIDDAWVVNKASLSLSPGCVHVIMGPNGSGKSSLAQALAGHPQYPLAQGRIELDGIDISQLSLHERARRGIFLAFQNPPAIPGVRVLTFLKEIYHAVKGQQIALPEFEAMVRQHMQELSMDPAFLYRSLNEGFSGGERKKFEMLQLLILSPRIAILDEIDSGLDVDALALVCKALARARRDNPAMTILLITHYQRILRHIEPDYVHIMSNGSIAASGGLELALAVEHHGYDAYAHAR